ncbi:MAG: hypothetical protein ABNH38_08250 [Tateyamaria sp.]|jgi:hypothetical protein|uniref:hypothetical protein n=1 Tax=Tateyamaria sp. TaxID=1929288 RepID=UPI0032DC6601
MNIARSNEDRRPRDITSLAHLPKDARVARYGPSGRSALKLVFSEFPFPHFPFHTSRLVPVMHPTRGLVGLRFLSNGGGVSDTLDYSDTSAREAGSARILWQPSNQNLARRVSNTLEERLVRTLMRPDQGYPDKISRSAANYLGRAIVATALGNALGADLEGHLATLRGLPPSQHDLIAPLVLDGSDRADLLRDLIFQAPILTLFPDALPNLAGQSPKAALKTLGLPPTARNIKRGAIAPLAKRMRLSYRHTDAAADLGWLTSELCRVLPPQMGLQRAVMDVGCILVRRHMPALEVAAFCTWLCKSGLTAMRIGQVNVRVCQGLCDYRCTSSALLREAGVAKWTEASNILAALENAYDLTSTIKDLGSGSEKGFPVLEWMPVGQKTPHAHRFYQILRERDLRTLARQAKNCVSIYSGACEQGTSAIYVLTGKARASDLKYVTSEGEKIIAVVELTCWRGLAEIEQIEGPDNKPVRAPVRAEVQTIIDTHNAMRGVLW